MTAEEASGPNIDAIKLESSEEFSSVIDDVEGVDEDEEVVVEEVEAIAFVDEFFLETLTRAYRR
jgi:hypothetical protein